MTYRPSGQDNIMGSHQCTSFSLSFYGQWWDMPIGHRQSRRWRLYTNGCNLIARPSQKVVQGGYQVYKCGARFKRTGCSLITSSKASHTRADSFYLAFWQPLMLDVWPRLQTFRNECQQFNAISLGKPHWCILSSGPTTITNDREVNTFTKQVLTETTLFTFEAYRTGILMDGCRPLQDGHDDHYRSMRQQLLEAYVFVAHDDIRST